MTDRKFSLLIDGQACDAASTFPVVDPATGQEIAQVPNIDAAGTERALDAANRAFGVWSKMPLSERRPIILRWAELLEAHQDEILDLLIAETGKPADNAEYDFGMLTTCLRFFVEEAARIRQEVIPDPDGRFLHYTLRQPLGVVVGYLAWNFPLLNLGYKLGPVLASGCTTVIKPSSQTPLASLACVELLEEAGMPPGVVNVITSDNYDATGLLLESPIPEMITMIGSTASGVNVMRQACTSVKHFSVELGGNAPVLVYPDADVEDAAVKTVDLKLANCGQVCVSPNRCFVHESVYDQFLAKATEQASLYKLGTGRDEGPLMGPMMTDKARGATLALIEQAVADGASVVCGGKVPDDKPQGFFLEPTILRDVRPEMKIAAEEIFGPVLPVIPFSDDDDELALANDVPYGLAAYVFTTNLSKGLRAAAGIDSGSVCVNEVHYAVQLPHGGLKQSGVGKDCSRYSIEEYLTLKRVSVLQ